MKNKQSLNTVVTLANATALVAEVAEAVLGNEVADTIGGNHVTRTIIGDLVLSELQSKHNTVLGGI